VTVAGWTLANHLAANARPVYERLAAWLGRRLGEPAALTDAPEAERWRMLSDGRTHVAFLCGLPYVRSRAEPGRPLELLCAPVMAHARYGGRPIYFTDVVVRRDSGLASFADLRGRRYAYNDRGSNSGYAIPRDHLLHLGETRGYFGEVVEAGAHQASLRLVLEGRVDASGIDSTVLELEAKQRPEIAPALRVVETIGPHPIPAVVVSSRLPAEARARLRAAFLAMHEDPEGRAVLAEGLIARFVPVTDADYDPIRALVARAEAAGFLELR
jgi:phosphonate transport system substrate-binding protein